MLKVVNAAPRLRITQGNISEGAAMEFPFPVTKLFKQKITKLKNNLVPESFLESGPQGRQCAQHVSQVVDAIGLASATAQRLTRPVTSADRLRKSDHTLYVLKDPDSSSGNGRVAGFLKMGNKNLYLYDKQCNNHETKPLCVLDFYIHENLQRRGLGKQLFDHMLRDCDVAPKHLALDSPSDSFMAFVRKNYGLFKTIPQVNHFCIFDDFFSKRPDGRVQYTTRVHGRVALRGGRAAVAQRGGAPSNSSSPCSTPTLAQQEAMEQSDGRIPQATPTAQEVPEQYNYLQQDQVPIPAQHQYPEHISLPGSNWCDPRCSSVGDCLSYSLYGNPWSNRNMECSASTPNMAAAGYVVPHSVESAFPGSRPAAVSLGIRAATSALCTPTAGIGYDHGDFPAERTVSEPLVFVGDGSGGAIPCAVPPSSVSAANIAPCTPQIAHLSPSQQTTISHDQSAMLNYKPTMSPNQPMMSPGQRPVPYGQPMASMSPGQHSIPPGEPVTYPADNTASATYEHISRTKNNHTPLW